MTKYISNRQRDLKIGITSYTENLTVLEVTGGAYISSYVGLGTTNPTQSLHVQGSARLTGALYDSTNVAGSSGQVLQTTGSGIIWTNASDVGVATYADRAGIATYADRAGIATYADIAGIATYATNAGIATYADVAGIATYATNAGIATYADVAGIATYADVAGIATYATNAGIATYADVAGIATYADVAGIATYATNAGIATYADRAGIATYATNAGIATYADVAGIATYATNAGIATYADVAGIATYATNAGVSTSVIGGIGSITELYVSGISTLGTVLISSGIVTATVGVVTYYGDGSKLTGIQTSGVVSVVNQDPNTPIVYPTLVNNVGVSSLGISTTKLSFIPSSGKLGLGTVTPRENLDVIGTIGIQSAGTSNRFYLQHNSSENSLDFIFV